MIYYYSYVRKIGFDCLADLLGVHTNSHCRSVLSHKVAVLTRAAQLISSLRTGTTLQSIGMTAGGAPPTALASSSLARSASPLGHVPAVTATGALVLSATAGAAGSRRLGGASTSSATATAGGQVTDVFIFTFTL